MICGVQVWTSLLPISWQVQIESVSFEHTLQHECYGWHCVQITFNSIYIDARYFGWVYIFIFATAVVYCLKCIEFAYLEIVPQCYKYPETNIQKDFKVSFASGVTFQILFTSQVLHHNPLLPGLPDHALQSWTMIELITTQNQRNTAAWQLLLYCVITSLGNKFHAFELLVH